MMRHIEIESQLLPKLKLRVIDPRVIDIDNQERMLPADIVKEIRVGGQPGGPTPPYPNGTKVSQQHTTLQLKSSFESVLLLIMIELSITFLFCSCVGHIPLPVVGGG
jgi:hypothetical protein